SIIRNALPSSRTKDKLGTTPSTAWKFLTDWPPDGSTAAPYRPVSSVATAAALAPALRRPTPENCTHLRPSTCDDDTSAKPCSSGNHIATNPPNVDDAK